MLLHRWSRPRRVDWDLAVLAPSTVLLRAAAFYHTWPARAGGRTGVITSCDVFDQRRRGWAG
eukprot:12363236-Alexandrium_andersonii.AAC.1